ncbi:ferritin-like domain-containing protein [Rubrolithibacter danxiaensis]|uniref:ferritin-like domain-containing protein n=1 Tax=Rubrolithibacter danxiaensis TaxID=3390805 RepID=UPI003BF7EE29
MTSTDQKIIAHLNHLLSICKSGKHGYQAAAKNAQDEDLKNFFSSVSIEREKYIQALKYEVRKAGGDPDKSEVTLGTLHRTWMDVKSAFSAEDDKVNLEACITGEKAALQAYKEVLEKALLPADTRNLIALQKTRIEKVLSRINDILKKR